MKQNIIRNIILPTSVLLLAYGCEKNFFSHSGPKFSLRPIVFDELQVDVVTKADYDAVSGEFPENATVGVLGYCLTENNNGGQIEWNTKKTGCYPFLYDENNELLQGLKLTKNIDGGWNYAPLKMWYENDDDYFYSFFAYSPCDPVYFTISTIGYVSGSDISSYKDAPVATFTLPFDDNSESLDRCRLRDAMLANNIDHRSIDGNVGFQFYHMTAGLRFRINNYNQKLPVTISEITLKGSFNKQMTIESQTDYEISGEYTGKFSILDAPMIIPGNTQNQFVVEDDGVSKVSLLLIANLIEDAGTQRPIIGTPSNPIPKLTITYQTGDGIAVTRTFDLPTMNYRNGIMHNISFNFLGNSLTLSATETEWDAEYISDIVFE